MTHSPADIRRLLDEHGLRPSRALGQNFVADPNTVRRIARLAAVGPGDAVVEIGAGLGSLTLALVETGADVVAVETDRHLVPVLEELLRDTPARVLAADAMKLDWQDLLAPRDVWTLVANLPYNVATPLVADLLDGVPKIARMLVMVQREVAERLAAAPGTSAYGAVSVKVAYWAEAEVVGRVPATVFVPRPRVESALVSIVRRAEPAIGPEVEPAALFRLVRAGFGQRRKMLRGSLAGLVPAEAFAAADVDPRARAEDLDVRGMGQAGSVHTERAFAKLTRSLRVTGVRADGYHLIDAEMVSLDLCDVLTFAEGDQLEVLGGTGLPVPEGDDNIVRRALAAVGRTAHVRLEKRIPAGGGLGGGSADAAAVLRWAGVHDLGIAAGLGADVPFCIDGGRARVTGIGEELVALPFEAATFTLLTPPFGVATAAVYRMWDDLGGPAAEGPNDLEPAALAVEPRLGAWRDRLGDAAGVTPVLAGSGSTWFVEGEFPGDERVVVRATSRLDAASGSP